MLQRFVDQFARYYTPAVVAIAALGVKTSFEKIVRLGWRPIALLVSETLFIALFMLLAVWWQARG